MFSVKFYDYFFTLSFFYRTDWRQLLDDEEDLYKSQSVKWKKVLSSSLLILDQIKTTMQNLYKRVDEI